MQPLSLFSYYTTELIFQWLIGAIITSNIELMIFCLISVIFSCMVMYHMLQAHLTKTK